MRLIFSGDQSRTVAWRLTSPGREGRPVHALMSDYTSSGPLRLYRFLLNLGEIHVITYDTTRREIVTSTRSLPDKISHQFTLTFPVTVPTSPR